MDGCTVGRIRWGVMFTLLTIADVRDMSARRSILMEAIFMDLGSRGEIDRL